MTQKSAVSRGSLKSPIGILYIVVVKRQREIKVALQYLIYLTAKAVWS
jgi:hypothetical protein